MEVEGRRAVDCLALPIHTRNVLRVWWPIQTYGFKWIALVIGCRSKIVLVVVNEVVAERTLRSC